MYILPQSTQRFFTKNTIFISVPLWQKREKASNFAYQNISVPPWQKIS
jgi:hypothetical protein